MPAVWNPQANEIFLKLLEMPPEKRDALLQQACGGDAALGAQVRALLAASDQAHLIPVTHHDGSGMDAEARGVSSRRGRAKVAASEAKRPSHVAVWVTRVTVSVTRSEV